MPTQIAPFLRSIHDAGGTLWLPEWEFDAHPDRAAVEEAERAGLIRVLSDGSLGNSIGLRLGNKGRELIGERPLTLLDRLLALVAVGRPA